MLWTPLKYILLLSLIISVSKIGEREAKEVNILNECSKLFKNQRIQQYKKGEIYLSKVLSGYKTGSQACRELLLSSFVIKETPGVTLLKVKDDLVFKNLVDIFIGYFSINDFRDDNTLSENYYVYDLNELAKLYVFNLLLEEPVSYLLQGYNQVIELGDDLIGRTFHKSKSINVDRNTKTNVFSHSGGGLLGHNLYLLKNLKLANDEFQTEQFSTRIYPISVFKDFFCRTLPVLKKEDAYPYVLPHHEIELKTMPSCMQCHATMDPITNLVNKIYERNVKSEEGQEFLVAMRAPAQEEGQEPLYYQQERSGYLRYRTKKGEYVNLSVKSLDQLGDAISSQNDFYQCMGEKMANSLGVSFEEKLRKETKKLFYEKKRLLDILVELI